MAIARHHSRYDHLVLAAHTENDLSSLCWRKLTPPATALRTVIDQCHNRGYHRFRGWPILADDRIKVAI